jgi:hypothetical protein
MGAFSDITLFLVRWSAHRLAEIRGDLSRGLTDTSCGAPAWNTCSGCFYYGTITPYEFPPRVEATDPPSPPCTWPDPDL